MSNAWIVVSKYHSSIKGTKVPCLLEEMADSGLGGVLDYIISIK